MLSVAMYLLPGTALSLAYGRMSCLNSHCFSFGVPTSETGSAAANNSLENFGKTRNVVSKVAVPQQWSGATASSRDTTSYA